MDTLELTLPSHWASAFFNSDTSGLEPEDEAHLDAFTDHMVATYGQCWPMDASDDVWLQHYHDATPYGVLGCDVSTYTFDITAR